MIISEANVQLNYTTRFGRPPNGRNIQLEIDYLWSYLRVLKLALVAVNKCHICTNV